MLIHTDQFWSYLINEPPAILEHAKRLLTYTRYNFTKNCNEYDIYWQELFNYDEYVVLRFPTGLCDRLLRELPLTEEKKYTDPNRRVFTKEDVLQIAEEVKKINPKFEIRDYQIKAALTALNNFNCIVQSSTGSGKSSVISMVCKILKDDKILITNGNNIILQQIYDRLISFGITDIGWNPSGEPDYDKRIVLINTATSDSRLNSQDEKYVAFLKTVDSWFIDECFSGDTEVLTSKGYKRFDELNGEELFANFNSETKEISFTKGKLLVKAPSSSCLKWKLHRNAEVIITSRHQQLYYNGKNEKSTKDEIQNISFTNPNNKIYCSGYGIGKRQHLSATDKIIIDIATNELKTIEITLLSTYFDLSDFSRELAEEFIQVALPKAHKKIYNRDNVNFISAVAILAGYEVYQHYNKKSAAFTLSLKKKNLKSLQQCKREEIKPLDKVYCVEVPEHNIIVRNGGDAQYSFISGNCQHAQGLTGFEPIFYTDEEKLKRWTGFTATPFRRYDAPYDNDQDFRLIALLGEPKFKYEMQDTIADKNIAKPYGYFIRYKNYVPNIPDKFKKDYFMQYRMGITYNKARNAAGLAMLKYLAEHNVITLACVNKIKNGQKIIEELTKQGIKCKMICGNQHGRVGNTIFEYKPNKRGTLKLEETDGTVEDLEKAFDEGYNVIVGTSVLQEGADVQRFQAVVLFTGAKDYIGSTQMIGRAVRKKKTSKNIALVVDFNDRGGIPILAEHCNIRKAAMIKNGVQIIEKVEDFCKLVDELNKP